MISTSELEFDLGVEVGTGFTVGVVSEEEVGSIVGTFLFIL
jgi:hypothetical protein